MTLTNSDEESMPPIDAITTTEAPPLLHHLALAAILILLLPLVVTSVASYYDRTRSLEKFLGMLTWNVIGLDALLGFAILSPFVFLGNASSVFAPIAIILMILIEFLRLLISAWLLKTMNKYLAITLLLFQSFIYVAIGILMTSPMEPM